jgi:hypothetical protein
MLKVRRSGTPTATASGCRTFFRSAAVAGFVGYAFDAHNGEDQYGSETVAWSAIDG